jgi:hypothetical protein
MASKVCCVVSNGHNVANGGVAGDRLQAKSLAPNCPSLIVEIHERSSSGKLYLATTFPGLCSR